MIIFNPDLEVELLRGAGYRKRRKTPGSGATSVKKGKPSRFKGGF
jgi:hypothetical protein